MPDARYIRVILPLMHLDWVPTYRIPEGLESGDLYVGKRVNVSFCGRKQIGVVSDFVDTPDVEESKIRPIDGIAEGFPDISSEELELWKFISEYYLCPIGEVFKAAYPLLRVNSERTSAACRARKAAAEEKKTRVVEVPDSSLAPASSARSSAAAVSSVAAVSSRVEVLCEDNRCEKYVARASETLECGRSVLVLMPEISVGEKLEQDFRNEFGSSLLMYNSRQTAAARRRTAEALRDDSFPEVVLGTRSALFLPFKNLGLIIVDEEQDPSYKQTEPAPRYQARDVAVMLGRIHGADVILGSASPSFETAANLLRGKYSGNMAQANDSACSVIDVSAEKRKRGMNGRISIKLLEEMRLAAATMPASTVLLIRGWEKVEEIVDTLVSEGYSGDENQVFRKGTQTVMILTPSEARLIHSDITAVLQADAFFAKTDFRADERVLQMLVALRGWTSKLIIQTSKSSHPVFRFETGPLLKERKDFNLPPFTRLVDVIIRDNNESRLRKLSYDLHQELCSGNAAVGISLLSADGLIRLRITVGITKSATLKAAVKETVLRFEKERKYTGHIIIDVDPA